MSDSEYATGTYVKGDKVQVAQSASRAVALRFDGYKLVEDPKTEVVEASEAEVVVDAEAETAANAPVPTAPKTTNKN